MSISTGTVWADQPLVPIPFEALAQAGASKQKAYDEGQAEANALDNSFLKIGSIDRDTPEKKEIVSNYQKQVEDLYQKSGHDYSRMTAGLTNLSKQLQNDLANGKLGAIKNRYDSQQASIKDYEEAVDKKTMSRDQAKAAMTYDRSNQDALKLNEFGVYNGYSALGSRESQDLSKIALDYRKEMTPQKIYELSGLKPDNYGYLLDNKGTRTMLTEDFISQAVAESMKSDKKVQDEVKFRNTVGGRDKELQGSFSQLDEQAKTDPSTWTVEGNTYNPNDKNTIDQVKNHLADQYLNKDIYDVAKSTGNLTKRW